VQTVHKLWLNVRREPGMADLHHSDIVSVALTRLAREWVRDKDDIMRALRKHHMDTPEVTGGRTVTRSYFSPPTEPLPSPNDGSRERERERERRARERQPSDGTKPKEPTEPH
jgi:hypothetical protein